MVACPHLIHTTKSDIFICKMSTYKISWLEGYSEAAYRKALCEERLSMHKDLISNSIHFLSRSDFPHSMEFTQERRMEKQMGSSTWTWRSTVTMTPDPTPLAGQHQTLLGWLTSYWTRSPGGAAGLGHYLR